jgi:hypothetical protein
MGEGVGRRAGVSRGTVHNYMKLAGVTSMNGIVIF